jgi:biopolymer transport protein TolR
MAMSVGSGGSKKTSSVPGINVTPLVDVVLVVLIIFMIVTPMMTKTFWLNLPKEDKQNKEPPPPSDNKPLVLTVDQAGVIRANQTVLSKTELGERVPRMLAAKNQKILYFDAHDEVSYGKAVEIMDITRAAGVRSIAILTEKIVK